MADPRISDKFRRDAKRDKARKQQEMEDLAMSQKYRNVFGTPEGKEVFRDLMEFCMTFQRTMTGNSWTYFNEGKRAVGLHILMRREQGWESMMQSFRNEHEKKLKEEMKYAGTE